MLKSLEALDLIFSATSQHQNYFRNILINGNFDIDYLLKLLKESKEQNVNFNINQIHIIDISQFSKAGDMSSIFLNFSDDDIVILKYSKFQKMLKDIFVDILRSRKIILTIGSGKSAREIEIDVPNFTLILIVILPQSLDRDLSEFFNIRIDLKGQQQAFNLNSDLTTIDHQKNNLDKRISAEIIYNWRDSQREPDIIGDTELLITTLDGEELFENFRAYVDYLCTHHNLYENVEQDTCKILVDQRGVYKDILLEAFLGWEGGEDEIEEFKLNGVSVSSFFDWANTYKDIEFKRILLFRFLRCFELLPLQYNLNNMDKKKFEKILNENLVLPKDFQSNFRTILSNLLNKVCVCISDE